jgi:hypothetical protein
MSKFSNVARDAAMVTALLVSLTGCGGGGGSDPQQSNPPPPSAPAPTPAPTPPPASPPASPLPPVAAASVDISDGHKVGVDRWGSPLTDGTPRAGFDCVVNPPQTVALHSHLSILVNNELQSIPKYVGAAVSGSTHCFYPVHTDDASGRIHVISATQATFTLGQLFTVWGQTLSSTNVAGVTGLPVEVYVTDNGTVTKVEEADWANIELKSHREITIELGTPLTEIPNFTWTN